MLRLALLPLALATLIASGCDSGAGSGNGGAGGSGGAIGGAGGTTGGSGGTGGTASGSGGTGGQTGGKPCDGTVDQWCGYDAYCDAPTGSCPGADVIAVCAPVPKDCTGEPGELACGCNGQVYVNACEAHAELGDVGSPSDCTPPADPFACGPVLCQHGTEYCETSNGFHLCKPLPQGCDAAATMCDCLEPVFCFSAPGEPVCEKDANGDFFVSCTVTE